MVALLIFLVLYMDNFQTIQSGQGTLKNGYGPKDGNALDEALKRKRERLSYTKLGETEGENENASTS